MGIRHSQVLFFIFIHSIWGNPVKTGENSIIADCFRPRGDADSIKCEVLNVSSSQVECIEPDILFLPNNSPDEEVTINCTAPYPIDVKLSRSSQLRDAYHKAKFVRNAENVFNEATFVYSIGLSVKHFVSPLKVSIMKYSDPSTQLSFFIFAPGNPREIVTKPIEKDGAELIIPCISSDPHSVPSLKLRQSEQIISILNISGVSYDVRRGFVIDLKSDIRVEGRVDCIDNKSLIAIFNIIKTIEFKVEPNLNDVTLFQNDHLKLTCRSRKKIQLVELSSESKEWDSQDIQTTVDGFGFTASFTQRQMKIGDQWKIGCVEEENQNNILHVWNIKTLNIYNNTVLRMGKPNEQSVGCYSNSNGILLETVFCQGISGCDLMKSCFDQGVSCPQYRRGSLCKHSYVENYASCMEFPSTNDYFSQGMIRCKSGNSVYGTKYFRGFDGVLYLNWETAPLNALIDVRVPTNVTMFPHNSYPFGCRASKFISDGTIQWVIKGKDGSEILLHKKRVKDISPYFENMNYTLHTVRESNIRLIYPNDYDVLCLVPMWNATGSLRNLKRINVAQKTPPVTEILVGAGVIILLLLIPLLYVVWRLKKTKESIRNLTDQEVDEFLKGNPDFSSKDNEDSHEDIDSIPYNKDWEIPRDKLVIDTENILGEGAFGRVLKGKIEGVSEVVAVKTVKSRCEVNQFKGFLSELKIMIHIGKHPFVVGLIGAYTPRIKEKIVYIVVEYCVHGSLEHFLRHREPYFKSVIIENDTKVETYYLHDQSDPNAKHSLNLNDLIRFSHQVASGMTHLASKRVVHADLAARNVLIHANGNCKITDFGLSRQLFDYAQYVKKHQEPLPWRWMAIESLRNMSFSTQSDVWSYGVLLWEIFSLADIPYPGLSWSINFVDSLTNGLRMCKPPHATSSMYQLMLNCWHENPYSRPSFQFLSDYFQDLLESLLADVEANPFPIVEDDASKNCVENIQTTGNVNVYHNS